jgi:hypothetical protein
MKKWVFLFSFIALSAAVSGQVKYAGKIEMRSGFVISPMFDCGAGQFCGGIFSGPERAVGKNVFSVESINGISFFDGRAYAGAGIGYFDAEGIVRGYKAFVDMEYLFLKGRVSPLVNMRMGHSQLHNNHNGLREGSPLLELAGGVNVRFARKLGVYLKGGLQVAHDSHYYLIGCGFRF